MPDTPDYTEALLATGLANPWIGCAVDPPFTRRSLAICADLETLVAKVFHGGGTGYWCLGVGFVCGEIAVINQVGGGHEWLVCWRGKSIDSYSHPTPEGFLASLKLEIAERGQA